MASTRDPPVGLRSICCQARLNHGPDTDFDTDPDTDPALDPDLDLLNSSAFGCFPLVLRLTQSQAPRPTKIVGTPNPIPIPREILSDKLRLLLSPSGCPLVVITTVCEAVFVVGLVTTVGKVMFIVGVGYGIPV
jgi:hypothetical protein